MAARVLLVVAIALATSPCLGDEIAGASPLSVPEVARRIDEMIQARLDERNIAASPRASDLNLLRRVTLDLAGRIPTRFEIEEYKAAPVETRYEQAVARLVESPDYAFHLRNELDALLLARKRNDDSWREYLLWATRQNRPWSDIFADLLLPEPEDKPRASAVAFLKERVREPEQMANDTAVLFFGVNIGCAQCHDHPLVADWQQKHFYGMMAFFNRTYKTKKETLAEKPDGQTRFKTVAGEEFDAPFMFLNGECVDEPLVTKSDEERKADLEEVKRQMNDAEAPAPLPPPFRPREELVRLALKADQDRNGFLARAIVNRTWARLLGYGFVEPLDQMHSENPPSHPELLQFLTQDLVAQGYDLRRLIHAIVLTEAYCRSTETYENRPFTELDSFAAGLTRPLSPWQVSLSLLVASQNPDWFAKPEVRTQWENKRGELERQSISLSREIELPGENFQVGVEEALLFSNHPRMQNDYLRDGGDKLFGKLKGLSAEAMIEEAFLVVFTRRPTEQERQFALDYLTATSESPPSVRQNLLWALLTSPEFRFNH